MGRETFHTVLVLYIGKFQYSPYRFGGTLPHRPGTMGQETFHTVLVQWVRKLSTQSWYHGTGNFPHSIGTLGRETFHTVLVQWDGKLSTQSWYNGLGKLITTKYSLLAQIWANVFTHFFIDEQWDLSSEQDTITRSHGLHWFVYSHEHASRICVLLSVNRNTRRR